jgi:lipocalin
MNKKVKMVQSTPHKWQLLTQNGTLLKADITANDIFEAKEFVVRYISSFSCWDYEIIPLEDENRTAWT